MGQSFCVHDEWYDLIQCGECGIKFLAPTHWVECRRDRGDHNKLFVCPNGHTRIWSTPEIDRIRQERDRLKQQIAQKDDEICEQERKRIAAERKAARIQKRAHAGVCPCCSRTFQDVVRHMKDKHPEVAILTPAVNPKPAKVAS